MDTEGALTLEELAERLGKAYVEMVDEFQAAGKGYPYNNASLARIDFTAFVRELEEEKEGVGLPPGVVAQTTYVLVRDGKTVLGEFRFRPTVPAPYFSNNGHVGYNVCPPERRKGYATRGLALVLDKASERGLDILTIPVQDENPGSVRAIERNRGVLACRDADRESGEVTSWYRIEL